jgi:hypothetical protein
MVGGVVVVWVTVSVVVTVVVFDPPHPATSTTIRTAKRTRRIALQRN